MIAETKRTIMAKERIVTGKAPVILVTCPGDLKVKGWMEPSVMVKGSDFEVTETEKAWNLDLDGDAVLFVPDATSLTVVKVAGDLAIRNLEGPLVVSEAAGDVSLRTVSSADLGAVHGDLSVRSLGGALEIAELMGDASLRSIGELTAETIYGDLAVRNVERSVEVSVIAGDVGLGAVGGDVSLMKVHGDASLRNIGGICQLPETSGDIRLRDGLVGGKHLFVANGKIVVRWPSDTPVAIDATAPAFDIHLPLEDVVEENGTLTGHIGDGDTLLRMEAKKRIIMKEMDTFSEPWGDQLEDQIDFEFDLDLSGLGDRISSEISSRFGELSNHFGEEFEANFTADIEQRMRDAASRAERAAERAMRQAEKASKKARWQAQSDSWSNPAPPSRPSAPKEAKATEAEQLKILRMVENGVITPDEAATLLEALEN